MFTVLILLYVYQEILTMNIGYNLKMGHAVAQLVETLRYKPEGRGFDS